LSPRTGLSFLAHLSGAFLPHANQPSHRAQKSDLRKAALQAHGLTADSEDKPLFFRLSADRRACSSVARWTI
jgi:hypothetical protein